MFKKTFYVIGLLSLMLFLFQNSAHVPVVFLTGRAHLRAVFLMLLCFAGGFAYGYYFVFRKEEDLWKKIRHLRILLAREKEKSRRMIESV